MNDYPRSIDDLDLDAVVISPEIVAAVKRFAASKPYGQRGSVLVTPAVTAGLTDHVWEIEDLVKLID